MNILLRRSMTVPLPVGDIRADVCRKRKRSVSLSAKNRWRHVARKMRVVTALCKGLAGFGLPPGLSGDCVIEPLRSIRPPAYSREALLEQRMHHRKLEPLPEHSSKSVRWGSISWPPPGLNTDTLVVDSVTSCDIDRNLDSHVESRGEAHVCCQVETTKPTSLFNPEAKEFVPGVIRTGVEMTPQAQEFVPGNIVVKPRLNEFHLGSSSLVVSMNPEADEFIPQDVNMNSESVGITHDSSSFSSFQFASNGSCYENHMNPDAKEFFPSRCALDADKVGVNWLQFETSTIGNHCAFLNPSAKEFCPERPWQDI